MSVTRIQCRNDKSHLPVTRLANIQRQKHSAVTSVTRVAMHTCPAIPRAPLLLPTHFNNSSRLLRFATADSCKVQVQRYFSSVWHCAKIGGDLYLAIELLRSK